MSEDLAHDAHLRAALRHAPDHALSPPSGLSQTILAAARQVHRPLRVTAAAPPPMRVRTASRRPLRAWLRRLFAPRWAGAWATGLVAALGLGLWLDLDVQPVVERTEAVAKSSTQPDAAPAEATRAPPPSEAAADTAHAPAAKAASPAPTRAQEMTLAQDQVSAPRAEAGGGDGAPVLRKDTSTHTSTRAAAERAAANAARDAGARQAAQPPQQANPPAVAAAPANNAPTDQLTTLRGRVAAPRDAQPPAATGAAATNEPSATASGASERRMAAVDARKAEIGEAAPAASPALTLLRRARGELATGSAAWTWAAPGSVAMAPFDDAAQAWLLRVVQLARGRWVDVSERGESLNALEVRWWRDGWPRATLRIEDEGVRWIEPSGRIRYAPLDDATLQRLRSF